MNKDKWVTVYDGDGKRVATVNGRGEMRSLGKSNDKGARVRDEIRAAELQESDHDSKAEFEGYYAHFDGTDVPRGGWAGWLEREISTHDERLNAEISALVAAIAHSPPPDGWQDRVHAECDKIDEQRRHDVAASVARHAEVESKPYDIDDPESVNPLCGMTNRRMDEIAEEHYLESIKDDSTLDGIDQSEPTPAPDEPLVEQQDIHDEPTHVGTVDDRFEDGDGL